MSFLEDLLSARRSIRRYKAEKPAWEMIEKMLEAAALAPSPSNSRPVRYLGLKSLEIRERLNTCLEEGRERFLNALAEQGGPRKARNLVNAYFRFSKFMINAPWLFAVGTTEVPSFSKKLVTSGLVGQDSRPGVDAAISVGLSLKAFILRGEEQGIGSCILTAPFVFMGDVKSVIPCEDINLHCFVAAGFPDETPGYIERSTAAHIYREI